MKIFITRHRQTEWNVLGKLQGRQDIKLNEVGREQAVTTSKKIKNEKIDIIECLDEITTKYQNKNVLIVTHGSASIYIKCYFMKYPLENLDDKEKIKGLENCEVIKFEV